VGQYISIGQRIYALQGGQSCTTASAVEVVGNRDQNIYYVYCRLDQPSGLTPSFDGAQFDCVGSRLGCHPLLAVETTNGR
jgi:hypothetical protein